MRYRLIVLALLSSSTWADSHFRLAIQAHSDLDPGKGQCDIRLEVDEEAQVTIRGDQMTVHSVSGQDARDDGSDCNIALPNRDVRKFALQPVEGRGAVRVVEQPSKRNDFAAVVHIADGAAGVGRYHFRLTWESDPNYLSVKPTSRAQDDTRPPVPPGFVWNNAITYRGRGSGESLRADQSQPLTDARVDIDLGGNIVASFTLPKTQGVKGTPRPLLLNGTVMTREGSSIRASMVTADGKLHGTMTLSVDDSQNINSISLNATDGQERLRLSWARR